MAENFNFKVSYIRITEEGIERFTDVYLSDIVVDERKDIKSLIFLPIATSEVVDITNVLTDFPILEQLYLPSTMTTTIKSASKECPMLKTLVLLTQQPISYSLDKEVVNVTGREEEGDNFVHFRTFVATDKDGKQTMQVHAKQVRNHEIIVEEKVVEYLSTEHVNEYLCGENGILATLDTINAEIEDERCKIEIDEGTLKSLLGIFVEKGVTFEEFTIDFSKLYDKIESYKSIVKTVNQVSIKEEIEGNIVESYQNVLRVHYENLLKGLAPKFQILANATTLETQNMLIEDIKTYLASVIVDATTFDEDFRTSSDLDTTLDEMPSAIVRHIRTAKDRGLVRKYLAQAVSEFKANKEDLFVRIEKILDDKADVEGARNAFANAFSLDVTKKQSQKLIDTFANALTHKNFGVLTKNDVTYVIDRIKNGIVDGEISGKELIKLIETEVGAFVTREELRNSFVEVVAENGYTQTKTNE